MCLFKSLILPSHAYIVGYIRVIDGSLRKTMSKTNQNKRDIWLEHTELCSHTQLCVCERKSDKRNIVTEGIWLWYEVGKGIVCPCLLEDTRYIVCNKVTSLLALFARHNTIFSKIFWLEGKEYRESSYHLFISFKN